MEKQIILMANTGASRRLAEFRKSVANMLNAPLRLLGRYYSHVLGHDVDMRRTKILTEVQAAFFLFIMPADYPLLLRAVACLWFVVTLRRCKKML